VKTINILSMLTLISLGIKTAKDAKDLIPASATKKEKSCPRQAEQNLEKTTININHVDIHINNN
jgi:hypothetical protein